MSVNNGCGESSRAGCVSLLRFLHLSTLCPPVSFHYFVLFSVVSHPFLPAAIGASCRARVICRSGYESTECPSGRNIILNDDIRGTRGTAETASRSLHVHGITREMKITERHVHVCFVYMCTCKGART